MDFKQDITPNSAERAILILIVVYTLVIAVAWKMPYVKHVLFPFKAVTIAFHEFGHACMGKATGAKIKGVELDPELGGVTHMAGGIQCLTLPAGYLGSSLVGGMLIFCAFDVLASKIAAGVIIAVLILVLFWARNWFARGITIGFAIILVVLYFIANGVALRYFILFMGVMSSIYSVMDILDDLVFRKVNESDASQFAKTCPICPAQGWGVIWGFVSVLSILAAIVLGLAAFHN